VERVKRIPVEVARRSLLAAQGLFDDPGARATSRSVLGLVERMGFVQIDSINVVARAHHLTLHSRLDGYRPPMLERLLVESRELFEHWTHDASAIPTRWFEHWPHRFRRYGGLTDRNAWWRERLGTDPARFMKKVLARIEARGEQLARDFERSGGGSSAWWGWSPEKAALEHLWRTGQLGIARRVNFQKVYDLLPRVLPEAARRPPSAPNAHLDWACRTALERLGGFGSPRDLASFWRAIEIAEARRWCEAAAARGELVPVAIETADGSKPHAAFALPEAIGRPLPELLERTRLLSPFDPVLRDRARTLRLFGFDYRFEGFVPKARRRHGYYVMPILEGDRLVGRVDPKLHRERGVLELLSVHWEGRATRARKRGLEDAAARVAELVGASSVEQVR
jgi:uncharacterized protein YcaQ